MIEGMRRRLHLPRFLRLPDRVRTPVTRILVGSALVIVFAAMAFGARDPAATITPPPVKAPVHTARIGPLQPAPSPARITEALQKVGIDVRLVRDGGAALITTRGVAIEQGTLNIEYGQLPHGIVVWPPKKCMTIRADLGRGAWVTYAPSVGLEDCLPSNVDLTSRVLETLEGATG
jgi:hypothetical protein